MHWRSCHCPQYDHQLEVITGIDQKMFPKDNSFKSCKHAVVVYVCTCARNFPQKEGDGAAKLEPWFAQPSNSKV